MPQNRLSKSDSGPGSKGKCGLAHFSKQVLDKVKQRTVDNGFTTYQEVADELVTESTADSVDAARDSKNVRRRVYDALNVLLALDVISRDEQKNIQWIAPPKCGDDLSDSREMSDEAQSNDDGNIGNRSQGRRKRRKVEREDSIAVEALTELQREYDSLLQELATERKMLAERTLRKSQLQSLILLNSERDHLSEQLQEHTNQCIDISISTLSSSHHDKVSLPFLLVSCNKDTKVTIEVSEEEDEYNFSFSSPFKIYDDAEIIRYLNIVAPSDGLSPRLQSHLSSDQYNQPDARPYVSQEPLSISHTKLCDVTSPRRGRSTFKMSRNKTLSQSSTVSMSSGISSSEDTVRSNDIDRDRCVNTTGSTVV
ncbi:E2F/DP family winged-helix DNA-binding domain-containing protein [Paraphysoderma sedebokerense]|nr:E2F/DP family winged-helix DNA-binding domain-containing protein [Paraphysoderma sedebokerense]